MRRLKKADCEVDFFFIHVLSFSGCVDSGITDFETGEEANFGDLLRLNRVRLVGSSLQTLEESSQVRHWPIFM
jgi:hypothetical protein